MFYHDFGTESKPNEHICVFSEEELKLIALDTNECQTISLPMKFESAFVADCGILLVRARNDEE